MISNDLPLKLRLSLIGDILIKHRALYSQEDTNVIKGEYLDHPWINKLINLSSDQRIEFDAKRNPNVLEDNDWATFITAHKTLTKFPSQEMQETESSFLGNSKKKHELSQLKYLLSPFKGSTVVDFGGGVGNLAHFLENELSMSVEVLEQNPELIAKGKQRLKKFDSTITFKELTIDEKTEVNLNQFNLGIGLHTCGSFATDIMRLSIKEKLPQIINFGCCYSKIKNHDYNLSSFSNKEIKLNSRALSFATLGFQEIPVDFFAFRQKIIHYKLTFYNWYYSKFNQVEFKAMSNSRRTLFDKPIDLFFKNTIQKFFPDIECPSKTEIDEFYASQGNQEFLDYLWAYYATARYFGELIEVYILCDRALMLQENGYSVEIREVFDPKLSPRNKVIIAKRQ